MVDHEKYKTTDPDRPNRYKKNSNINESEVLEEVHIYTNDLSTPDYPNVAIPIEAISKLEVYDKAKEATTASWVLGTLGYTAGAVAAVAIIVALTKSSCPFI